MSVVKSYMEGARAVNNYLVQAEAASVIEKELMSMLASPFFPKLIHIKPSMPNKINPAVQAKHRTEKQVRTIEEEVQVFDGVTLDLTEKQAAQLYVLLGRVSGSPELSALRVGLERLSEVKKAASGIRLVYHHCKYTAKPAEVTRFGYERWPDRFEYANVSFVNTDNEVI
jgi:hypothetical protein